MVEEVVGGGLSSGLEGERWVLKVMLGNWEAGADQVLLEPLGGLVVEGCEGEEGEDVSKDGHGGILVVCDIAAGAGDNSPLFY